MGASRAGELSPVARFSIALALVLAVTAGVLAAGTALLIGRYVEDETARFTEESVASHFGTIFDSAVFRRSLTAQERQRLEQFVVFHFSVYGVVAAQFFSPDGTIVFSYDGSEVGRRIEPRSEPGLASALADVPLARRARIVGDPRFGVTVASDDAMAAHGMGAGSGEAAPGGRPLRTGIDTIEAWVPIHAGGDLVGAVAVWRDFAPTESALRGIQSTLGLIIALAATALWLVLRGVYVRSSQRIVAQSRALTAALAETERAYDATLHALSSALDVRDSETEGHSVRVVEFMELIVSELGVPASDLRTLRRGALLHDVGKIGVPDHILRKPGPLTESEWRTMRRHPEHGASIVAQVPALEDVAAIVRHHHERYDGTGYPDGLAGEQIPFGARLFGVADSFDAMTSNRPYRRALDLESARREVIGNRGTQFDPAVVDAFARIPLERLAAVAETGPAAHRVQPVPAYS